MVFYDAFLDVEITLFPVDIGLHLSEWTYRLSQNKVR